MLKTVMLKDSGESVKILVAGHFGAGKTTFVKTLSQKEVVSTERKTSLKEERDKKLLPL